MARKKKTGAKPKAKPAAKKRETRRPSSAEMVVDESEEMQDPVAVGLILMTAVFLVAALVVNMMHLGIYEVGLFK